MHITRGAPAAQAVTTAEAKTHLQVDHSADDTYIDTLVEAAVGFVEDMTGLALVNKTITVLLDARDVRGEDFTLPESPLSGSITSFQYYDTDGNLNTVDSTLYYVAGTTPATVVRQNGGWTAYRKVAAFKLVYTAGYGADGTSVPTRLLSAVKKLVEDLYAMPGTDYAGTGLLDKASPKVLDMLAPFRRLV